MRIPYCLPLSVYDHPHVCVPLRAMDQSLYSTRVYIPISISPHVSPAPFSSHSVYLTPCISHSAYPCPCVFHSVCNSFCVCSTPCVAFRLYRPKGVSNSGYPTQYLSHLMCPTPCESLTPYISYAVCIPFHVFYSVCMSGTVNIILLVTYIPLRACPTPRVSHSARVTLRACPTPCVSHFVSHFVCIPPGVYPTPIGHS